MKKFLASLLATVMVLTTMSACVIPVSAEDTDNNIIFNENFENYATGENWIDKIDENGFVSGVENMDDEAWTIYGYNFNTTTDGVTNKGLVEIVADPKDPNNKVLRLSTGNMNYQNWYRIRRNSNGDAGLNRKTELNGKKMVLKAKMYTEYSTKLLSDTSAFNYDPNQRTALTYGARYFTGIGMTNNSYNIGILGVGGRNYGYNTYTSQKGALANWQNKQGWSEVKFVYDLTDYQTADHPTDTYRAFFNGELFTAYLGYGIDASKTDPKYFEKTIHPDFPQPSTTHGVVGEKVVDSWGGYNDIPLESSRVNFGDFYGASITVGQASGKTDQAYYMDDIVAYYVDPFKLEGNASFEKVTDDGIWYAGKITIPFNNNVATEVVESWLRYEKKADGTFGEVKGKNTYKDTTYKNLFTLKDAEGNVVEGGISDAYAEGKNLIIVPSKDIARNTSYTIVADAVFIDEDGQGLNFYSDPTDLLTFETAEDPYAHILYTEGFEDYAKDVNWYDYIDSNRYVTAEGIPAERFTINKGTGVTDHSAMVVDDPLNEGNKVLKLSTGTNAEYQSGVDANGKAKYSTIISNIRINVNGKTGITRASMGKGKKLVYKAKIYMPDKFVMNESSFLTNPGTETGVGANQTSGIGCTNGGNFTYPVATGGWNYPMARGQFNLRGSWAEVKHVVDVSKPLSETHSDTIRGYVDGVLSTAVLADSGSKLPHGVNERYPIKHGDNLIDFVTGKAPIFGSTPYATFGNTYWGSHFTLNGELGTETANNTYYIDDLEAYWIDVLNFDVINADNYLGGKVELKFNQKIQDGITYYAGSGYKENKRELKLEDLFTIEDKNGEVVENAIKSVALSEDGKSVYITPSVLSSNEDYKIVISPYLIDEHGQGLENNGTATKVDLHVGEYVPFTMESLTPSVIKGFTQGRIATVTATFSVTVPDEAITEGIIVKNTDTGAVIARNEGWTATYGVTEDGNTDPKTIVFDFSALPTANYTITDSENFKAVTDETLATEFEVIIEAATSAIVLFEENFETGYTKDENWIKPANEITDGSLLHNQNPNAWSNEYYKSYSVDNHKWDIQLVWDKKAPTEDDLKVNDFIGVVENPYAGESGMTGKVLKVSNDRATAYNRSWTSFRRNFDGLEGISLTEGEYAGKTLILEVDAYTDAKWETSAFMPSRNLATIREYSVAGAFSGLFLPTDTFRVSHGSYAAESYGAVYMWTGDVITSSNFKNKPTKLKIALDQTSEVDTIRVYNEDGSIGKIKTKPVLEGHPRNNTYVRDIQGTGYKGQGLDFADTLYGIWSLASNNTLYIDNMKAYLVDSFNVTDVKGASDVFNTAKASVTYTFSKAINPDTVAGGVALLDENGNEVVGGIKSATLADGNYQLIVKLSDTLSGSTNFTIVLKDSLRDIDDLALATQYYYYDTYNIKDYYDAIGETGTWTTGDGKSTYNNADTFVINGITHVYTERTATTPATLTSVIETNKNGTITVTKYDAPIDCYIADVRGTKEYVDITTSKSASLFAEADKAAVNGNTVTTNVVFTNPEIVDMDVFCVIAAYGNRGKLIGYQDITQTVTASTRADAIPVSFTVTSPDVKSVKMFVWNNRSEIKSYQKAETLFSK